MKKRFKGDLDLSYDPWFYFFIFLAANILLSYFPLSLVTRLWIFLMGLALPLFFAVKSLPIVTPGEKPGYLVDPLPKGSIPGWVWGIGLVAALFLRFGRLGDPAWWPGGDDSLMAMYSLDLLQHWKWRFFETLGQDPSTLSYFGWLVLRLTHSPILAVQFPPAAVSALTLVFGYVASRQFFPRTLSLIFSGLLAFNYWALSISIPFLPGILMPLWECLVLACLGRFLNSTVPAQRRFWSSLLGFTLGLGPFTFFSWPVLVLWVLGMMAIHFWKGSNPKGTDLSFFILGFFLSMAPFLRATLEQGYGGYLSDASAWKNFSSWMAQVRIISDYVGVLFWGGWGTWAPVQGGFLNALLGAFFFLGIIELFRFPKKALPLFLGLAFLLFLLPGFLSKDVETHRILLVLPLLLVIAAMGIQSLLLRTTPGKRTAILFSILLLTSALDVSRLFPSWDSFFNRSVARTSNERLKCYGLMESLSRQEGPGLIFSEMIPNTQDYSLFYASSAFSAAEDPGLAPSPIKWAAIFTESHYAPLLAKRFPNSQWFSLPTGTIGVNSRHILGLIPPPSFESSLFQGWEAFYQALQRVNFQLIDSPAGRSHGPILKDLLELYPSVPTDPFLQSCFFEKLTFVYSWEKTFHPEDSWTDWDRFSGTFRHSFEKGYQDTVLCEKFGRLLLTEGKVEEARGMFKRALRQDPGNKFLKEEIEQALQP